MFENFIMMGEAVFAYYKGSDSNKLCFNDDQLIRWRYLPNKVNNSKATNYDFDNISEYYRWEKDVLAESEKLLPAWEDALVNNSKSWYTPTIDSDEFEESVLNSYEIANRNLIVEYEAECGYR